jgi:hypothetical protein
MTSGSLSGSTRLREIVNQMLETVLLALSQDAKGGVLGQAQINAVFDRFMSSPDFEPFFEGAYHDILDTLPKSASLCRRDHPFGRLMVQPLVGLFEKEKFERDILPNLFNFFHMVLGDDEDKLSQDCQQIVDDLQSLSKEKFTWELFYRDPHARKVYWHVLVRIAILFKRWDLRKEWFLKLMQYTPTTTSLGSMAFQVREPASHDSSAPMLFGEDEFKRLFLAMFDEYARLPPSDLALFRDEFGAESVKQVEAVLDRL